MFKDFSFGVIPLQKINDIWHVLLIQQKQGYWCFPKGHSELDEMPLDSAIRELKEETDLNIKVLFTEDPIKEQYFFTHNGKKIDKTVFYFIAEVEGVLNIQQDEILSAKWVELEDAENLITYPESKALFKEALAFFLQLKKN